MRLKRQKQKLTYICQGLRIKMRKEVMCDNCKRRVEIERDFEVCPHCGFIINHEMRTGAGGN